MDITDSNLLICLLALRQFGGKNVPAKQDLFAKGLKPVLKSAVEQGLVSADKMSVTSVGTNGKAKVSKVDVLNLTDAGEAILQRSADPEALAATRRGELVAFRQQLEADREKLRTDILASLPSTGKGKPDALAKDLSALTKSVQDLAKRLEKVEERAQGPNPSDILNRLDAAFAQLSARLGGVAGVPSPAPAVTAPASLREILRLAYEDLHGLLEYQDGPVPLPRLFHQARVKQPGLTLADFHRELLALREERVLDLMVLNEVRTAAEPEKGIRQGDNLYYFVIWRKA